MVGVKKLKILDLNDDCLMAICEFLGSKELFALHRTHRRFHNAILAVVKNVPVKIRTSDYKTKEDGENLGKFLQLIGAKIKNITFYVDSAWKTINVEHLVHVYCSRGNVKECTFSELELSAGFIRNHVTFFRALTSLSLEEVNVSESVFKTLARKIDGIEKFKIHNARIDTVQMMLSIAAFGTETLDLGRYWTSITLKELERLKVNSSVKQLKMQICYRNERMLQHFPQVNSLELEGARIYSSSILNLVLKLKNLTTLSLGWTLVPEDTEIDGLQSFLESLAVSNTLNALALDLTNGLQIEEICEALCKLTNLKKLCLSTSEMYFDSSMLDLARSLTELQTFQFFIRGAYFDVTDEEIMLKFLEIAKNLRSLCFRALGLKNRRIYQLFYDEVVDIREEQETEHVLNIEICDHVLGPMFIQRNKWVRLTIKDDIFYV